MSDRFLRVEQAPQRYSHVRHIHLHENIAGGRGQYTTISVLEPGIRVERSKRLPSEDPSKRWQPKYDEEHYRIILTFKLQAEIIGFDHGFARSPFCLDVDCSYSNTHRSDFYKRFFDSVSLKYLYHHGESHRVLPAGDLSADLKVTDENSNKSTYTVGVQNAGPNPTGKLDAQVERNDKISYEAPMKAWREGLSYEPYKPRKCPLNGLPTNLGAGITFR